MGRVEWSAPALGRGFFRAPVDLLLVRRSVPRRRRRRGLGRSLSPRSPNRRDLVTAGDVRADHLGRAGRPVLALVRGAPGLVCRRNESPARTLARARTLPPPD